MESIPIKHYGCTHGHLQHSHSATDATTRRQNHHQSPDNTGPFLHRVHSTVSDTNRGPLLSPTPQQSSPSQHRHITTIHTGPTPGSRAAPLRSDEHRRASFGHPSISTADHICRHRALTFLGNTTQHKPPPRPPATNPTFPTPSSEATAPPSRSRCRRHYRRHRHPGQACRGHR